MRVPMGVPDWRVEEILRLLMAKGNDKAGSDADIRRLEQLICEMFGGSLCVATELGRQAITLALMGAVVGEGDGVILPSFVCPSVIFPILKLGCIPQFADIGKDLNVSPVSVLRAIDDTTRVVIVPHLFGRPARIEEIGHIARQHNLVMIDDAAQAMGAKRAGAYVGGFGDAGIFSFGPFKSIVATRGGSLLVHSPGMAENIRRRLPLPDGGGRSRLRGLKGLVKLKYRKYFFSWMSLMRAGDGSVGEGWPVPEFAELYPARVWSADAAVARMQIERIDEIVKRRHILADRLSGLLKNWDWIETVGGNDDGHAYVKYVIRLRQPPGVKPEETAFRAQTLIGHLRRSGIEAHGAYRPLHLHKPFAGYAHESLRVTEDVWQRLVCLPINPGMSFADVDFMASRIREFENIKENQSHTACCRT